MKTLILITTVFFYLQPSAEAGCDDMAGESDPGGHPAQHMEQAMDAAHDCCDAAPEVFEEGCNHDAQCSTCTAGMLAVAVAPIITLPFSAAQGWEDTVTASVPRRSFPLFRPPIS